MKFKNKSKKFERVELH